VELSGREQFSDYSQFYFKKCIFIVYLNELAASVSLKQIIYENTIKER